MPRILIADDEESMRTLVARAIAMDGSNLRAWLYLAGMAGDPALTLAALEHVLEYQPENPRARQGTLWARNKLGLAGVGPPAWQV